MLGQLHVVLAIIQHEVNEVEPGQERRCQVDVVGDADVRVVAAADGVGARQDAGARIERGDEAGLGHGDGLLLHHLVQHAAGRKQVQREDQSSAC